MKTPRRNRSRLLVALTLAAAALTTTACEKDIWLPSDDECHYDANYRLQCGGQTIGVVNLD